MVPVSQPDCGAVGQAKVRVVLVVDDVLVDVDELVLVEVEEVDVELVDVLELVELELVDVDVEELVELLDVDVLELVVLVVPNVLVEELVVLVVPNVLVDELVVDVVAPSVVGVGIDVVVVVMVDVVVVVTGQETPQQGRFGFANSTGVGDTAAVMLGGLVRYENSFSAVDVTGPNTLSPVLAAMNVAPEGLPPGPVEIT